MKEKFFNEDKRYKKSRIEAAKELGMSYLFDVVDQYPLYCGVNTLGKTLAVYEIIKKTLTIPGHIVEFGCYKGGNLLLMAKILRLLQPNTFKYVYGFESFEGLKDFSLEDNPKVDERTSSMYAGDEKIIRRMIDLYNFNDHVHLVKGDAMETIPSFENENPHIMFSLAYIDFDLYAPCVSAINFVHKRLCPGGIMAFDESLTKTWPGEGQAMVEFLNDHTFEYKAESIDFARQPTALLIKK